MYFFLQDILVALSSFPEDCGDLILDIAEAFMENGKTVYTVTLKNTHFTMRATT